MAIRLQTKKTCPVFKSIASQGDLSAGIKSIQFQRVRAAKPNLMADANTGPGKNQASWSAKRKLQKAQKRGHVFEKLRVRIEPNLPNFNGLYGHLWFPRETPSGSMGWAPEKNQATRALTPPGAADGSSPHSAAPEAFGPRMQTSDWRSGGCTVGSVWRAWAVIFSRELLGSNQLLGYTRAWASWPCKRHDPVSVMFFKPSDGLPGPIRQANACDPSATTKPHQHNNPRPGPNTRKVRK